MSKLLAFENDNMLDEWQAIQLNDKSAEFIARRLRTGNSVAGLFSMMDGATVYNMVFVPMLEARACGDEIAFFNWNGGNGNVYISIDRRLSFAFNLTASSTIYPDYFAEKMGMGIGDPSVKALTKFVNRISHFYCKAFF